MSKKLIPFALACGLLAGCVQQPVAPEPPPPTPLHYADPVVPEAPAQTTERIKEPSVLGFSISRGGAALRLNEDADVLAKGHYEAPSVLAAIRNDTLQNGQQNVGMSSHPAGKSIRKGQASYSQAVNVQNAQERKRAAQAGKSTQLSNRLARITKHDQGVKRGADRSIYPVVRDKSFYEKNQEKAKNTEEIIDKVARGEI